MESKKFSGWKQLLMISIITGLTAQYGGAAVSLSNTVMQNGAQVAMTATAFGLGSTVYSLMQGPRRFSSEPGLISRAPERYS